MKEIPNARARERCDERQRRTALSVVRHVTYSGYCTLLSASQNMVWEKLFDNVHVHFTLNLSTL
jgi:hypothetical protein